MLTFLSCPFFSFFNVFLNPVTLLRYCMSHIVKLLSFFLTQQRRRKASANFALLLLPKSQSYSNPFVQHHIVILSCVILHWIYNICVLCIIIIRFRISPRKYGWADTENDNFKITRWKNNYNEKRVRTWRTHFWVEVCVYLLSIIFI